MALADVAATAFLALVAVTLLALGAWLLRSAAGQFGLARQMSSEEAEPVSVAEAAPGTVAVSGTARPGEDGTIPHPLSRGEALVAIGSTLERSSSAEGGTSITTDERSTETVPFVVEDDTGSIRVDPEGAVHHGQRERFDSDEVDETALSAWLGRTDVSSGSDVGYRQQLVEPGDEVYVFGEAVATDGDPDASSLTIRDDGDLVVSTEGREDVSSSGTLSGIIMLFIGLLVLFFGLVASLVAVVWLLGL